MAASYWNRVLQRRLTRRRAVAVTGGAAFSAAFLAACGDDDDAPPAAATQPSTGAPAPTTPPSATGPTGAPPTSGLITEPVVTTGQAVRGGILKRHVNSEFQSFDPNIGFAGAAVLSEPVLGRLVGWEPAELRPAQEHEYAPDIAESWEISGDGMQIAFKLRPGVVFHDIPPVNGRALDTDDVLFSWERFLTTGAQRTALANELNPDAPIVSITTPDDSTVVAQLAFPVVYALAMFGHRNNINMIPKEAADPEAVDVRNTMIGVGPYYLSDFEPGVGYTLRRHEGFYDNSASFVDQVNYPIIPEYSSALAQFRAGEIYTYPVQQEEILPLKNDLPNLAMYQGDVTAIGPRIIFGWQSEEWRDERVRQALSMSYDRDLWLEVFNNASLFEDQGLPMDRRWFGSFPTITEAFDGWNLDPRDADSFGENAKYYHHDIEEAKKLLAAAGYPDGFEIASNFVAGTQYGVDHQRHVEVLHGFGAELGIRFTPNPVEYAAVFVPQYRDSNGRFEGISYRLGPPPASADPVAQMHYWYHSGAGFSFFGQDAAGVGDHSGDPYVDETITKAQGEFDTEARRALVHEVQRYLAGKVYGIQGVGGASAFLLAWPALGNFRAVRGASVSSERTFNMYSWVDETKPPYA